MVRKILPFVVATVLTSVAIHADNYPPGRELSLPLPSDTSPAIRHISADIACGEDQCLAVWMSFNDGERMRYKIRAARMTPDGQMVDRTSFEVADTSFRNTSRPQVIAMRDGYVVFYGGMRYARVTREGAVVATDATTPISGDLVSAVDVVSNGTTVLVYSLENRGPLVPWVTLLDSTLSSATEIDIAGQPSDVAAAGDGYVVASATVDGVTITRIAGDGSLRGSSVVPVWNVSAVVASSGDGAAVAWRRSSSAEGPATIEYAVIAGDGTHRRAVLDQSISNISSLDAVWSGDTYFILWTRAAGGLYSDQVFTSRVSATGELLDRSAVPVATKTSFQFEVKAASAGGNCIAVWTDSRFGMWHDHVFAAPISPSGVGADVLVSGVLVSQTEPVMAASAEVIGTAWREGAAGEPGSVMFLRLRPDGGWIDTAPLLLSKTGGKPAIAMNGPKFIVAWREFNQAFVEVVDGERRVRGSVSMPGNGDISVAAGDGEILITGAYEGTIYAARLRLDGTVIRDTAESILAGERPQVGYDGESYWLIAEAGGAVEARRLTADGAFLDVVPFHLGDRVTSSHGRPALGCGGGACMVLWPSTRDDESTLESAVLSGAAVSPGMTVARGAGVGEPAIAWTNDSFIAAWKAKRDGDSSSDIYAVHVSPAGNAGTALVIADSSEDESSPAVAAAGPFRVFAFSRASSESGERVYLRLEHPHRRRAVRR